MKSLSLSMALPEGQRVEWVVNADGVLMLTNLLLLPKSNHFCLTCCAGLPDNALPMYAWSKKRQYTLRRELHRRNKQHCPAYVYFDPKSTKAALVHCVQACAVCLAKAQNPPGRV